MVITVNGDKLEWPEAQLPLALLLAQKGIKPDEPGIAVAVNQSVVKRADWLTHMLAGGDVVEIITARQGG